MKTKLLILWLAMFTTTLAWADVEINETNFPDENFRNWVLRQEYGADGLLTNDEIATVTEIFVGSSYERNYNIYSLKGIEFFTYLTYLYCYGNQLTALDVSQNKALVYLDCAGNQLISLDVSQNTALAGLECGSNPLTSLDVSKNSALEELICCNNQLTTLNVSMNTSLRVLACFNNQLTTLDVSNTELQDLACYQNRIKDKAMDDFIASLQMGNGGTLYVLYYENEQNVMTAEQVAALKAKDWTPLYCSGLDERGYEKWEEYAGIDAAERIAINETNFPDAYFRNWLYSQDYGKDGILTADEISIVGDIDVSGRNIRSLQGIEYFTALIALFCENNQMTSLDVSKNTALTFLFCYNNQLTSLDVSGCTALMSLDCSNNQLTTLDVSRCTTLYEVYCGNNKLTSLDMSNNVKLVGLDCYQNQIKDEAMDALIKSLPTKSGKMRVIHNEEEQNVMTIEQVAAVKAKGWIPYILDGSEWREYAGSDPDGIKDIDQSPLDIDHYYYDLNGHKLSDKPTNQGLYIIGGKKVMVK